MIIFTFTGEHARLFESGPRFKSILNAFSYTMINKGFFIINHGVEFLYNNFAIFINDVRIGENILNFAGNLRVAAYGDAMHNLTFQAGEDYTKHNFINSAFTPEERALIVATKVSADANPNFNTSPGNETTDKIYLLSIHEVDDSFLSDAGLLEAQSTEFASKSGYEGASWWLRSPGESSETAARVFNVSGVHYKGSKVDKTFGVRPVLWINYLR